jgi:hypothetical protein
MTQKLIRLHQGVKNTIAVSFKNINERPVPTNNCRVEFVLMDLDGIEIFNTTVAHTSPTSATISIPSWVFQNLEPQYLKYSLYQVSNGIKFPVYLDTHFQATGIIQLEAGSGYQKPNYKVVTTFLASKISGVIRHTSEAVELSSITNHLAHTINIHADISCNKLDGVINIQVSENTVLSSSSNWTQLDSFNVSSTTSSLRKSYSFLTKDFFDKKWARIVYIPTVNTFGKITSVKFSTGI